MAETKEDFLKKVENSSVTLEKSSILANSDPKYVEMMKEDSKKKYGSLFDEKYFYYHHIVLDGKMFIVAFNYPQQKCTITIADQNRLEELNKQGMALNEEYKQKKGKSLQDVLAVIRQENDLSAMDDYTIEMIKKQAKLSLEYKEVNSKQEDIDKKYCDILYK